MKRLAVHGNLRRGMAHHQCMQDLGGDMLGVDTIWGFELYCRGREPYILEGSDKVLFEVYELSDKHYKVMKEMFFSGDNYEVTVQTEFGPAFAWPLTRERHSYFQRRHQVELIKMGDWRTYYDRRYTAVEGVSGNLLQVNYGNLRSFNVAVNPIVVNELSEIDLGDWNI